MDEHSTSPVVHLPHTFAEDPMWEGVSDAAFRLHIAAMCYSARWHHLSETWVSAERVRTLISSDDIGAVIRELVETGWWKHADGGGNLGYDIQDNGYYDWPWS